MHPRDKCVSRESLLHCRRCYHCKKKRSQTGPCRSACVFAQEPWNSQMLNSEKLWCRLRLNYTFPHSETDCWWWWCWTQTEEVVCLHKFGSRLSLHTLFLVYITVFHILIFYCMHIIVIVLKLLSCCFVENSLHFTLLLEKSFTVISGYCVLLHWIFLFLGGCC